MKLIVRVLISITILLPFSLLAQDDVQQTLYSQLKQNIEKSCQNQDFLSCINIDNDTCNTISQGQLEKISTVIETNSQAVAEGQFAKLLKEIKMARNTTLEENNINVEKANACGKEFLTN